MTVARPRVGRRAFTLIELLVVVSIIALLISILLPSLSQAREQARGLKCAANLSSLSKTLANYLTEWDNTVPINGILFPKNQVPTGSPYAAMAMSNSFWKPEFGVLWGSMGGAYGVSDQNRSKMYLCPSDTLVRTALQLAEDSSGNVNTQSQLPTPGSGKGYNSYAVNTVLNSLGRFRNNFGSGMFGVPQPWADPFKFTCIGNSSLFIVFIEEDAKSAIDDEVVEPPAWQPTANQLGTRHNRQGNVAFGDSHVESILAASFNNTTAASTLGTGMQIPYTRNWFPDYGVFAGGAP
jgi:prepilin-type N-terminal cleavage/methylation domain-containing protein/prepilin-type processing-associated H-X9-DG protein